MHSLYSHYLHKHTFSLLVHVLLSLANTKPSSAFASASIDINYKYPEKQTAERIQNFQHHSSITLIYIEFFINQMVKYSDITIVIPTLNEEKNIEKLIVLLKKTYKNIKVIVVDDGSTDKTQSVAKKAGVKVIDRSQKQIHGLCISVIEGICTAKTPYAIVMDGDMQHPYEKIKDIAEQLEKHSLVVGIRERVLNDWPWHRRAMSKLAIGLGHLRLKISGLYCKDIVSGFFGIQIKLFKDVVARKYDKYELKGYKVLFDTLKYLPKETKISQVQYDFGLRSEGISKINYKHIFYYWRSLFK